MVLFAYRFARAQLNGGLAPRLGRRHSGAQILLGLEGKMFGDLFLQASIIPTAVDEVGESYEKASQEFHGRSSALTLKKRAMMAAVCSQSRVSVCSCFRPTTVRR